MPLSIDGKLVDRPVVRAGFIGCGSHAFRNIYPALQYAPVDLVATCDLSLAKAEAFGRRFGAQRWYDNHRRMLAEESLDAVFIVTNYDEAGRPRYPDLAIDCLAAGCHVWMEKPPAAICDDIDRMRQAAARAGRAVMVGLKKMFFPANEKARQLMHEPDFGRPSLMTLQYPQSIPTVEQFRVYFEGHQQQSPVVSFLDHLCHPASLLLYLAGMPKTLYYERAAHGGGIATFTFDGGMVASLLLSAGASSNGGMERTVIISDSGHHIVVDNSVRVSLHRTPPDLHYGRAPTFYNGTPQQATAVWEPEFSLGQLYNKGLFLLGYWGEINEFAQAILQRRPLAKATLDDAWNVTRLFEAFAQGPGRLISLS
jgi:predicted dehydrogenase